MGDDQVRADGFDRIGRVCDPQRRRSAIGYISPMEFGRIVAAG